MRLPLPLLWDVARRLGSSRARRLSRLGATLATGSVALAVAVLLVSTSIVAGFEAALQRQLTALGGDLQIGTYLPEADLKVRPIPHPAPYLGQLSTAVPGLAALYPVVTQAALVQSDAGLEGILLKGLGPSAVPAVGSTDPLLAGILPHLGPDSTRAQVVLSVALAERLGVGVGDRLRLFFLQERLRARAVTVAATYQTGLEAYDQAVVFTSLPLVQTVAGFTAQQIERYELHLTKPVDTLAATALAVAVNDQLPPDQAATPFHVHYPEIFNWLGLQQQNIGFLLGIVLVVVVVNLAAAFLLRVTEFQPVVGVFQALGTQPRHLIVLFGLDAGRLLVLGLALGNALGLGLLALQAATGIVTLPEGAYFVRSVPVAWPWGLFALQSVWVAAVSLVGFVLPAWALSRLRPITTLKLQ
ncbi:MAG: ABC transporter permease [Bacteroidia bacterium]|nr:ABC transporter permease [Bacteroidia bacterium]